MIQRKAEEIVKDYDGGMGLMVKEIAAKHKISYVTARATLIKMGVYVPPRRFYTTHKIIENDAVWLLAHAERLLDKVIRRHESGLLPDRFIYDEIKDYFKLKNNKHD